MEGDEPPKSVVVSEATMGQALTDVDRIDTDIETFLRTAGEIFRAFRNQDSGCVSYGVLAQGRRWFVKHSDEPRGIESLRRARQLHSTVRHPALPRLRHSFETPDGLALVFDWVRGELLYTPQSLRSDPKSPYARFRALPVGRILAVLNTIYDVHLLLAERGFVAVDFYDGCIIYDFERAQTHLCDLDEYRPGPFLLQADRLPGSRRFMAPEEWQRGTIIDQVTNVYTLGRTAQELLGQATSSEASLHQVISRATAMERAQRYPTLRAFVEDWRRAVKSYVLIHQPRLPALGSV